MIGMLLWCWIEQYNIELQSNTKNNHRLLPSPPPPMQLYTVKRNNN